MDRATGDLLVVVGMTDHRADQVEVPGRDCTVAAYPTNEGYPADDPVVEYLTRFRRGFDQNRSNHDTCGATRSRARDSSGPSVRATQSELTDFRETE